MRIGEASDLGVAGLLRATVPQDTDSGSDGAALSFETAFSAVESVEPWTPLPSQNQPLVSLDEKALTEGFDSVLEAESFEEGGHPSSIDDPTPSIEATSAEAPKAGPEAHPGQPAPMVFHTSNARQDLGPASGEHEGPHPDGRFPVQDTLHILQEPASRISEHDGERTDSQRSIAEKPEPMSLSDDPGQQLPPPSGLTAAVTASVGEPARGDQARQLTSDWAPSRKLGEAPASPPQSQVSEGPVPIHAKQDAIKPAPLELPAVPLSRAVQTVETARVGKGGPVDGAGAVTPWSGPDPIDLTSPESLGPDLPDLSTATQTQPAATSRSDSGLTDITLPAPRGGTLAGPSMTAEKAGADSPVVDTSSAESDVAETSAAKLHPPTPANPSSATTPYPAISGGKPDLRQVLPDAKPMTPLPKADPTGLAVVADHRPSDPAALPQESPAGHRVPERSDNTPTPTAPSLAENPAQHDKVLAGDLASFLSEIPRTDPFFGSTGESRAAAVTTAPPPASTQSAVGQSAAQQIALALTMDANGHIELTLDPEDLGTVKVGLSPSEGAMVVNLTAERAETLDLLRRHADILARDLREAGYGDVSFQFGSETPSRDQQDQRQNYNLLAREHDVETINPAASSPPPQRASRLTAHGLDLRL